MKNKFKKMLLKICSALTVLGVFIGILAIPSKAAEVPLSLLDIANMKQVTLYYYSYNENHDYSRVHFTFVKDGVFGFEDGYTWTLNLGAFQEETVANQQRIKENIYTPYGLFYRTNWNQYQFVEEFGEYIPLLEDLESFLEYEFVVPVDLYNVSFENVSYNNIEFLDSNNVTLGYLEGNIVNLSNVAKIRCISSSSDYNDEPVYLVSGVSSASYSQGYVDGRNSANNIINNLQQENSTLQNVNSSLQAEISSLQSQLQNVNGSWQSVFFTMVDIPFLTMSNVLNFDLFGLNLYRALIGMLTILAIFFLFRKLSGK